MRTQPTIPKASQTAPKFVRTFDQAQIATYEFGNPQGHPLVFVHGFCQSHLAFERLYHGRLAEHFRIVSYDLRGHGDSDKPDDAAVYQSSATWIGDLNAVLSAKNVHQPVMVGWSMGGRILREYLVRSFDTDFAGVNFVASQIVEDTRCRGTHSPKVFPAVSSLATNIEWSINFLEHCYLARPPAREFERALAYNMVVPDHVRRAIAGWSTEPQLTTSGLKRVSLPVLLSYGQDDEVVLPLAAELAAMHLHNATVSWYENCGHSPFAEHPQRFEDELLAFAIACRDAL